MRKRPLLQGAEEEVEEVEEAEEDHAVDDGTACAPFKTALLGLAPSAEFEEALGEALEAVAQAMQQVFGEGTQPIPFGSIVQGVHLTGSDLDLCFDVPGEDADICSLERGADNTRQVSHLKQLLAGMRQTFRVIETRLWKNMKVPIIILGYQTTSGEEIEADISVGTWFDGVEKGFADRLIRRLLAQSARALHLTRLVKLWAKVEKVNKAYDGFLNSLGWTLLVLYFCMQRGYVCPTQMHEEEPDERGLGGDVSVLPPPLHVDSDEDELPGAEEVAEFFEWVASWETWWAQEPLESGAGLRALSVVDGAIITAPGATKQWADQSDFFIEEPGVRMAKDVTENLARSLKEGTWGLTIERCSAAAAELRADADSPGAADVWIDNLVRGLGEEKAAKVGPKPPQAPPPFTTGALKRPWMAAPGRAVADADAAAKRARAGICKWFLKGECWSGEDCKSAHCA